MVTGRFFFVRGGGTWLQRSNWSRWSLALRLRWESAIAVFQLWLSKKQAETVFGDSMTVQYREIVRGTPLAALLGEELSANELDENLGAFPPVL